MAEKEWPIAYPLETDAAVNEMSLGGYNPNTLKEGVHQRRFSFSYLKSFFQGTLPSRVTDVEDIVKNIEIENIATLRLTVGSYHGQIAIVQGYYNSGDGGGGPVRYWDAASTAPDDGGSVIKPTAVSGAGRWLWRESSDVFVEYFGAFANGITNDSPAFTAGLSYLSANGGGTLFIHGSKNYYLGSTVNIPAACGIESNKYTTDFRDAGTLIANTGVVYTNPSLDQAVNMYEASSLKGITFIPLNLQIPADPTSISTWRGRCIRLLQASHGIYIGYCNIIGYLNAIDNIDPAQPSGYAWTENFRIEFTNIDCVAGIRIGNSLDVSYIDSVHCWPSASIGHPLKDDSYLVRSGYAFNIETDNDWTKLTNCFNYGYITGFFINNAHSTTLIGCGSDYTATTPGSSYGLRIVGNTSNTVVSFFQVASHDYGAHINTTFSNEWALTRFIGCGFWSQANTCIRINDGALLVDGCFFNSPTNAIEGAGNTSCLISANNFFSIAGNIAHVAIAGVDPSVFRISQNNFYQAVSQASDGLNTVSVASATPLVIPDNYDDILVTGTVGFSAITTANQSQGRLISLKFDSSITISNGTGVNPIKLNGGVAFNATANDILILRRIGLNWFEISRAVF